MTKTMTWPTRVIYILIALALAIGLAGIAAPTTSADPGTLKWSKVGTPTDTDWVIAPGSDIYDFAVAPDGETIYAVGTGWDGNDPAKDCGPQLWKSTDGGATWSNKTAKVNAAEELPFATFTEFSAVAVAPDDADLVVVAGSDGFTPAVVVSSNGATKFYDTSYDITGSAPVWWRCMDISPVTSDKHYIAVGTETGEVWVLELGGMFPGWTDATTKTGWQASIVVTSLAFSPAFATDKTLVCVTPDFSGLGHLQMLKWGVDKKWNVDAGFSGYPVQIDSDLYVDFSDIALPSDFMGGDSSLRNSYVVLTDECDSVSRTFSISGSSVSLPLGPADNPDGSPDTLLASIAYNGTSEDGKAMVGAMGPTDCCKGIQVYRTSNITDCCPSWHAAKKAPTGQMAALVAFTPDGSKAYAVTSGPYDDCTCGDESAFSVSLDDGKSWNQLALIDTCINKLTDVAVSPDCNTTYLVSMNTSCFCDEDVTCDSVWRIQAEADAYAGVWQRVWCGDLVTDSGLLRLVPGDNEGVTVWLGDMGTTNLWYSLNSGQWWGSQTAPVDIQDFALETEETVYVLESDGTVHKSTDSGWNWASGVSSKVPGHTIAVLPEGNVLVGGSNGKASYSDDGAATFTKLNKATTHGTLLHVAFDTYFDENSTIYAATCDVKTEESGGIYRWVIGTSTDWKDLGAAPTGTQLGADCDCDTYNVDYFGIVTELSQDGNPETDASTGGVLYAAYTYDGAVGVARNLTPAAEKCCAGWSWDYLHKGLTGDESFTLEPSSLRLCGCLSPDTYANLYAIDSTDYYGNTSECNFAGTAGRLWTYEDCVAKAGPELVSPEDGDTVAADPCSCYNDNFTLKWERLCTSCSYNLQIALDESFTEPVISIKGWDGCCYEDDYDPPSGSSPTYLVENGDLNCNTTYYWRVRVADAESGEIIHSWWSEVRSFTVEAGPVAAIDLIAPENGDTDIPVTNVVFTWSSVPDCTYDFTLTNAETSTEVVSETGLTTTAYTYTGTLDNDTPYNWQVKALKDTNVVSTSEVGIFYTAPVPPAPEPAPSTPAWVWAIIAIGAILVIVTLVLILRTRRV